MIFGVNGWGVLVAVVIWRVHQLVREALHEQHEPWKWGRMFMERYNRSLACIALPHVLSFSADSDYNVLLATMFKSFQLIHGIRMHDHDLFLDVVSSRRLKCMIYIVTKEEVYDSIRFITKYNLHD